jgi:hypothetical protein
VASATGDDISIVVLAALGSLIGSAPEACEIVTSGGQIHTRWSDRGVYRHEVLMEGIEDGVRMGIAARGLEHLDDRQAAATVRVGMSCHIADCGLSVLQW